MTALVHRIEAVVAHRTGVLGRSAIASAIADALPHSPRQLGGKPVLHVRQIDEPQRFVDACAILGGVEIRLLAQPHRYVLAIVSESNRAAN